MPTKPTDTFTWAKLANYTIGPFIGSPTKVLDPTGDTEGFVPGEEIVAEYANRPLSITGQWITDWIEQGSNAANLDAHIVETDADGNANVAALNLGGTLSTEYPLSVTENTGTLGLACVAITHAGNGACLTASTSGDASTVILVGSPTSAPCLYIEVSGSGAGQKILSTSANALEVISTSGRGVKAEVTSGTAVEGTATANGFAGFFTSNGSLDTVRTTNSSSGNSLRVQNLGTGVGVKINTTTGNSIEATSTTGYAAFLTSNNTLATARLIQNGSGNALVCTNSANDATIDCTNSGSNYAVHASAADNYAIVAEGDPTAPEKGTIRLTPQVGAPTDPDAGGLFFDSVNDSLGVGISNGGSPINKWFWGTRYGFCEGHNRSLAGVFLPVNAVTTISTVTVVIPDTENVVDGFLEINYSFQASTNGVVGNTDTILAIIRDESAGLSYTGTPFLIPNSALAGLPFTCAWTTRVPVSPDGAGSRQYSLRISTALANPAIITVIAPCMSIHGIFETDITP